jgi:hypothetical protein
MLVADCRSNFVLDKDWAHVFGEEQIEWLTKELTSAAEDEDI